MTVATTVNTMSYAGVVIVGVFLIADGRLTLGALVACSILSGRAVQPLATIASLLSRLSAVRIAYDQIERMMRQPSEGAAGRPLTARSVEGHVELRDVSFTYPDKPEKTLDRVNMTIKPGEHVALIGRVGSGKSTIARLILGLYEPQEGLVLVDGNDIRQLRPDELRAKIGSVIQETALLSGTVRENILLDREGLDDEEMLRAARLSGTHRFMGSITNGYNLVLADRGEGLSGGQRQSITIARALAGSPPILLFDEPTSAMDTGSEAELIERMKEELKGRTLILVTHRPSLLTLVNRVRYRGEWPYRTRRPARCHLTRPWTGESHRMTEQHGTPLVTQSDREGGTLLEDVTTRLKPATAASLLLWLILAFLVIAILWAAFAEIDRSIRAPARVVPSSQLQVISNLEGGIVSEILVEPGEEVAKGEPLIRLDETLTGAELGSTVSTIAAQKRPPRPA